MSTNMSDTGRLAPTLWATIQVMNAWECLPTDLTDTPALDWEQFIRDTVEQTVRGVFGDAPPTGLAITLQRHAAHALPKAAHDATMIIVGSRGLGGFLGLLLGSLSGCVAEHATCPVLVGHRQSHKD